jgi:hypothetical protein
MFVMANVPDSEYLFFAECESDGADLHVERIALHLQLADKICTDYNKQ